MDGLYVPNGRQISLVDRDWIIDQLPHLDYPDLHHLLTSTSTLTSFDQPTIETNSVTSNSIRITTGNGNQLFQNRTELDQDSALIAELNDEIKNQWSDLGVNRLLTDYARSSIDTRSK